MCKLLLVAACLVFIQAASLAEEPMPDPIAAKITAAKDAYYAERDKADEALIKLLEKREAAAKQPGDLKALEAVRAEFEAFRKEGTLPKSVPIASYESSMKLSRIRLDSAFKSCIKDLIKSDRVEEAKEVQAQLETLVQAQYKNVDPFQQNTLWIGNFNMLDMGIQVTHRDGEKFKARFVHGPDVIRDVIGTIKEGRFIWLANDVKAIKGGQGADFSGTVLFDLQGPFIEYGPRGRDGNITEKRILRLQSK